MKKSLSETMPQAWPIFFNKRKPRHIQEQAMPLLVRGESVLLSGPTASGKTEAAVAPLYQRHVSFKRQQASVVYVAPTKALVNDLFHRLDTYFCTRAPGAIRRYTGDRHEFTEPEDVFLILATPEALDSLQLVRPESLAGVRAIVVDEIHLLHGNARGQQLRHVISRIERNSSKPKNPKDVFQKIGMTATLQNMLEVGRLWLGDNVLTVQAGEARDIDISYLPVGIAAGSEKPLESAAVIADWLKKSKTAKVLVFGNTRNNTQTIAAKLHELLQGERWPVHWHTGVLAASERERVEGAMKKDPFGVCVATSTLEVGIDIGDIEAIVLADPPYSINGFLQRIGRGNRKTDTCRVIALYSTPQELALFHALHDSACNGILDDVHDYDRPSVRFQQILSYAWRGVSRDNKPLTMQNLEERTGVHGHEPVVNDMLKTGALENHRGALIPSIDLMDQGEKRKIHTTISGSATMTMVDSSSGETLIATSGQNVTSGALFVGGKMKQVTSHVDGTVSLEKGRAGQQLSALPATRGRRGLSRRIIWALAETSGYDPHHWSYEGNRLTTWGGSDYNQLFAIVLKRFGVARDVVADEYCISGVPSGTDISPQQLRSWTETLMRSQDIPVKDAQKFCDRSRYFSHLSNDMQAEEAFRSIPFQGFLSWLQECDLSAETATEDASDSAEENTPSEIVTLKNNPSSVIKTELRITWRDEASKKPARLYARALTSHLFAAACSVSGKTSEAPWLKDLNLDDCAALLRDRAEITLNFTSSGKVDGLAENWTLTVGGDNGNTIDLVVSPFQPLNQATIFSFVETFQWFQAQPEILSPVGLIALARNAHGLHFQAFHTLVGLAFACGAGVTAELNIKDDSETPVASWQSEDPGETGHTMSPVYSFAGNSLWLTETIENPQEKDRLWFTLFDPATTSEAIQPWLQREFWNEKISACCSQESQDAQKLSALLAEHLPFSFKVDITPLDEVADTPLMVPQQEGTVMILSPGSATVSIGLDLNQPTDVLEKAVMHAIAHLLCGHIRPADFYGHTDTIDSITGHGYLKRWDIEASEIFKSSYRSGIAECTTEEKAMLGLWRMIGEMLGESRRLHPRAEAYQRSAYQRQAAQRLLAQMEEFGGAMLCDGVGLGKTYIATTVMVHYANAWRDTHHDCPDELLADPFRITVLSPNSVVSTWQREAIPSLAAHGLPLATVRIISHSRLSRITKTSEILEAPSIRELSDMEHLLLSDLVIVDEAHNFRSLNARRSVVLRDLLRLQPRREKRRLVLLLTATPINNTLDDLKQETALLFSKPFWLSNAVTDDGYRRQGLKEVSDRCVKAKSPKGPKGDVAPLLIHGQADARFSMANDFRDDLDFGPNVQRLGDYLKEQDKKLKNLQQEIRAIAENSGQRATAEPARIAEELLDRIVVQRSRDLCKEIERQQGTDVELLFRADAGLPEKLRYSDEYDGTHDILAGFLPLFDHDGGCSSGQQPLSLKVYMWYDVREGIKSSEEISSVVGLQRILVLKRLESSPVSFLITLLRLTVLHAYRLQNLVDLCARVGAHERNTTLRKEIQRTLAFHNKKDLDKIISLATADAPGQSNFDFLDHLARAYEAKIPAAEADDTPVQLSLFESEDSSSLTAREQLDRLWDLKDFLLQDFTTLLSVAPGLADVVFGKFDRTEWPHHFTRGGEEVNWPKSPAWGLRVVTDAKLRALVSRLLLARREGQKVIVFCQFSDTLAYAHSVLRATSAFTMEEWRMVLPALGLPDLNDREVRELIKVTAVITGGTEDRDEVVNAFAPYYRIGPFPPATEVTEDGVQTNIFGGVTTAWSTAWRNALQHPIHVLFSSDVLAEGVNLQDATVLVNFDIHWNPVRMIQRSGRIDRRLNPRIEKSRTFPELEALAREMKVAVTPYYWHDREKEATLTVNMILPDELETELLLRERIAMKTLAIDFTLGLDQGTGAEADWMADYAYQGVSSLNAFQKDRAIEQVAGFHEKFRRIFKERGIQPEWAANLNSWFRAGAADSTSPLVGRALLGRRGETIERYERFSRYLEPALKDGEPCWCWAEKIPGESLYDGWLIMDGKAEHWPPPLPTREIDFHTQAASPIKASHLLAASLQLEQGIELRALVPQEFVKPFMQGATALAAPKLGSDEDRVNIGFSDIYILQLPVLDPEKLGRKIS
ncbi:MAG: DEAD/DEAH box helicase [Proteobacteria bacterium]|nr:DEAD/DEAH box helicase [Pseudomonadota bacterium]MBU1648355.1 DEAD/DEAH box helicase [Pseudomonadota bacterium]